jgi:hypothetical protein
MPTDQVPESPSQKRLLFLSNSKTKSHSTSPSKGYSTATKTKEHHILKETDSNIVV